MPGCNRPPLTSIASDYESPALTGFEVLKRVDLRGDLLKAVGLWVAKNALLKSIEFGGLHLFQNETDVLHVLRAPGEFSARTTDVKLVRVANA